MSPYAATDVHWLSDPPSPDAGSSRKAIPASATSQQTVAAATKLQRIARRPPVRRAAQMLTAPTATRIAAPTACRRWMPQGTTSSSTNAPTDHARSATARPIAAITCRRWRA